MAVVQGVKEKVHLPIYDCLTVKPREQWRDVETNSVIKFFVDVQGKTKLETNLQSASLLPHYNTFEARAMRVVISDLPPAFSDDEDTIDVDGTVKAVASGTGSGSAGSSSSTPKVGDSQTVKLSVERAMALLKEAEDNDGETDIDVDQTGEEWDDKSNSPRITVTVQQDDIESALEDADEGPPAEQMHPNNGSGNLVGKLVYNTVTTLIVGEKEMIRMPTWFFPAGAGPYSEQGSFTTHGEPSPVATFRFAEPIYIDKQQNFRVELEIPDNRELRSIQRIYGPLKLWVVLDGYMTRDVQ